MIDITCPWTPTSIFPALSNLKHSWREKVKKLFVAEKQISEVDCLEKLGSERDLYQAHELFSERENEWEWKNSYSGRDYDTDS